MSKLAIIGGTGLAHLSNLKIVHKQMVHTPFGPASAPLITGELCSESVIFIARHGHGHTIPPHKINYQANIWALKSLGVEQIIAVAAVGGITEQMAPKNIVIPDQLIDYTYSREHTFFNDDFNPDRHIDFTHPYTQRLREAMLSVMDAVDCPVINTGVYAATQGPRLETAAEINKLEKDGCDIVGMTGMPEAALARELEMDYATCAVVANWGAGRNNDEITMQEIENNLIDGMKNVRILLEKTLPLVL
ncbi:MAG: S-methyl-5'-thioinosine phosphorylase [Gammaproteobacteria bacterium]|nr:S-methyl-5'-thioinosine phosphorylase [Gammaproteobacteria bacterium]